MVRSVSTPPPAPPARRFARSRWLYQDQGRDIGPFRPDEIGELLATKKITADTLVRETTSQQWKKLGSIADFTSTLQEAAETEAARAKEKAFEKKVIAARTKRRIPLVIGAATVLAAGAIGGWFAWHQYKAGDIAPSSGFTSSLLKSLALQPVPLRAYLKTSGPISWAEENVELRTSTKDTVRRKAGGASRQKSATHNAARRGVNDLDPEAAPGGVRELSFEDDGNDIGRELDAGDVQYVRNTVAPRLVRCAQNVASNQPGWPGTSIRFSIANSGRLGSIRIGANGRKTASFVACVKKAIAGIKVKPFDGPGRTLTVPLRVGH
ncbi:MAG: DUF4339 domain-containing protein [Myxococcota bacterium]|nr:DUF4339 domain-containing protein [Myxococcota bacterium]